MAPVPVYGRHVVGERVPALVADLEDAAVGYTIGVIGDCRSMPPLELIVAAVAATRQQFELLHISHGFELLI